MLSPKALCRPASSPRAPPPRSPRACRPPDGSRTAPLSSARLPSRWQACPPSTSCCSTPFAPGRGPTTLIAPRPSITVDEQSDRRLAVLPEGVSLQQLVNSLNALGVGPRDMISILQAIKAAGALQAEIEVM